MSRYIDADDFAKRMLTQWDTANEEKRANIAAIISNIVTPILASTPTADVEPVRRGKWIDKRWQSAVCSVCGESVIPDTKYDVCWYPNYCHNCGAEMKGEEK